ncbi:MAG: hypothetical protein M3O07_08075 [Pseudomonadota bacterium]|nr:hypothetical protein [Pseudomonadota bacterium]
MNSLHRRLLLACAVLLPLAARAADVPPLSAATIRLFEQADGPVQPFGRRVYGDHFDATLTRMIGVEIGATYPAPDETTLLPVVCTLTNPDGSKSAAGREMSFQLFAGETLSSSANVQWGVADEQDWDPGDYSVDCAVHDQSVWQSRFTVALNPPDIEDTDIRVAGLRFFPVQEELPSKADRQYAESFEAADTRRIGVELEFTHSPPGRTVTVPVACHYYWPDGQVMPPAEMRYEPGPTWPGGYSAANMGWDTAGKWPVGHYVVVCLIAGKPVTVNRFEVR